MTLALDFWLWLAAFGLIAVGIAGTILPALPGVPLVFGGMLLAAWIDDFERIGYITLTVLGTLMLLSIVIDFLAGIAGAKRFGASRAALLGAAVGTVVGLFFGLLGLAFGPFVGALIGELSARKDMMAAGRVAFGTWLGMLVAVVVKLSLVFTMLGIFVFAYLVSGNRLPLV
ncbi:MAG: DUF456 domain-containing protein [Betaproteobacteria bacterium]|nr:MAG: DUF456 domain-containing protein [Betaproteobacteria bacterium]